MQLSQSTLKQWVSYDATTGKFNWLQKPAKQIAIGAEAGCSNTGHGYVSIRILGTLYLAHRLAFLYMTGSMPVQVDHDDHNRQNNIWSNLKASSDKQNRKNQSLRKDNTSGHLGVSWNKIKRKWEAYARDTNGIRKFLGYFTDKVDAIAAREAANIKYNYHVNHGK